MRRRSCTYWLGYCSVAGLYRWLKGMAEYA